MCTAPQAQSFFIHVKTWEAQWGHQPISCLEHDFITWWQKMGRRKTHKSTSVYCLILASAWIASIPFSHMELLPALQDWAFEWWNSLKTCTLGHFFLLFSHWPKQLWTLRTLAAITRGVSCALYPCNLLDFSQQSETISFNQRSLK